MGELLNLIKFQPPHPTHPPPPYTTLHHHPHPSFLKVPQRFVCLHNRNGADIIKPFEIKSLVSVRLGTITHQLNNNK